MKSNLFFDLTTLLENPLNDGIRRVTRSWFFELSKIAQTSNTMNVIPCKTLNHSIVSDFQLIPLIYSAPPLKYEIPNPNLENGTLFVPAYDAFINDKFVDFHPIASKMNIVSVIYDLLPIEHPEWFPSLSASKRFEDAIYRQCFYSTKLIVNSEHVKNRLEIHLKNWKFEQLINNIRVVPIAGKDTKKGFGKLASSKTKSGVKFLSVGTIELRKGYMDIIKSFMDSNPHKKDLCLTIIGRLGWNADDILALINEAKKRFPSNFFWLSNADDNELEKAYLDADIFLYAPLDEGFGLPLIEALDRGLVCVARDLNLFLETTNSSIPTFGMNGHFKNLKEVFTNPEQVYNLSQSLGTRYIRTTPSDSARNLSRAILELKTN